MYRSAKGRKSAETASGDSKQADEPSNCIICLEKVVCRGKLSVCNHWFCFPCILEWSENTNTCPICKARFRCITKVHLSPFRSPPTKVRVGDKDQRVWNDDDDLVAEDIPDEIDSDDVDDDYEPSIHVENPWTRNPRRQNNRRGNSETSRQLNLDAYDFNDSFIDDTDEALQAYLHSTYSQQALDVIDECGDDESGSESEDSSDDNIGQRTSPYRFRNRRAAQTRSSRNRRNALDSLPQIEEESSPCPSPASLGSFIVSDDESSDEQYKDWAPSENHSKNARNKGKSKAEAKKRKSSETSRPSTSIRSKSQSSHRPKGKKEPKQKSNSSKRKRQMSASEDEFQQGPSSRNRSTTRQQSIDGWISMASRRAEATATSSTSTQRATRERACKGKKPVKNGEDSNSDEECDSSSSDSDIEVLSVRIQKGRLKTNRNSKEEKKPKNAVNNHNASRTSSSTREPRNKQKNIFREQLKSQYFTSASTSTCTSIETREDAHSVASIDEDDLSNVSFIPPTPQPDKMRSIFTRRQHRSPLASFEDLEDGATAKNVVAVSQAETRTNNSSSINRGKTVRNGRVHTALTDRSNIQVETSPLLKKKKQKRKRLTSLSSDDE